MDVNVANEIDFLVDHCQIQSSDLVSLASTAPGLPGRRTSSSGGRVSDPRAQTWPVETCIWDSGKSVLRVFLSPAQQNGDPEGRGPAVSAGLRTKRGVELFVLVSGKSGDRPFCFFDAESSCVYADESLSLAVVERCNKIISSNPATHTSLLTLLLIVEGSCEEVATSTNFTSLPSPRLRQMGMLEHVLRGSSSGAECLLSLFEVALRAGFRSNSLCSPRPESLDLESLRKLLSKHDAEFESVVAGAPMEALDSDFADVLRWLYCRCGAVRLKLRPKSHDADMYRGAASDRTPALVFDVQGSDETATFHREKTEIGTRKAYHGTRAENCYSILQYGLRSLSGTRYAVNGAAFGDGVYLAADPSVSLHFAQPTTMDHVKRTRPRSRLASLRGGCAFVFVCDVIDKASYTSKTTDARGDYIIVNEPHRIQLRQLLVYDMGPSQRSSSTPHFASGGAASSAVPDAATPTARAAAVATSVAAVPEHASSREGTDLKSRIICVSIFVAIWGLLFALAIRRKGNYSV